MNNTIATSRPATGTVITAGLVATALMTAMMLLAPLMGMPKMDIGAMLGNMLGMGAAIGWMMHFVIGIIFAFAYAYVFNHQLPIENDIMRAVVYGVIVFVFAQAMMALMRAMGLMPSAGPESSMVLMMVGSLLGHIVYGLGLGLVIKRAY